MTSVIEQFRDALARRGIVIPTEIVADGNIHRCDANGKNGKSDAAYLLHLNGVPAGGFENWRDGLGWENWRADVGRTLSPAEEAAHRVKIEAMRKQRRAEEAKRAADAAAEAARIWREAAPAGAHPYLERKGIKGHGAKLHGGKLVVPMRAAGELCSLQFIAADGEKRFLPGGRVSSAYYSIGKPDGVLLVTEGFATGASLHEATGQAVAVAFNAGNLEPVAKALRAKFPQARIIIASDNDASGTGQKKAEEAARAISGMLAIPDFGTERPEGASDFNDLARLRGLEAVRDALKAASLPDAAPALAAAPTRTEEATEGPAAEGTEGDEIARLARLSPIEYDRERQAAADRLGVRASTLDAEVRRVRGDQPDDAAGEAVIFPEREPWPEQIDGAELLTELSRTFRRFIVLPDHADSALALWVTLTYFADVANVAPMLAAISPEKRCGKTSLLALLNRLAHRPLAASSISPAALFRAVEKWSPTLLIDEADSFLRENEELRGVLNSGHTRDTAFVIRTVGDDHEPRRFSTWGPKAIALIGSLPDTLTDRSIVVELQRKHASERVEKLRHAGDLDPLARRCLRFANDHREKIRRARPSIPEELHDRAGDNWEPLLAIADAAGGDWPTKARKAASVLSGATPDGDSTKVELLRDVRTLLANRLAGRQAVGSAELVDALVEDKAGRWAEFSHGRPLTQRQLARLLRPFGIVPGTVRLGEGSTPKGYRFEAFADAFARYLPPFDPPHRHIPASARVVADKASATAGHVLRFEDPPHASIGAGCGGVADQNPPSGGEGEVEAF
jgi:putative DNA primase/helicase